MVSYVKRASNGKDLSSVSFAEICVGSFIASGGGKLEARRPMRRSGNFDVQGKSVRP